MVKDTANTNCRELLDVLVARGADRMIISPGSRNTPLIIAADAREELQKLVVNDERTAAFTALGYAMVSRKPVILACTSGTAMYNYTPAIAEAFYQRVPLIVITADRPRQWIDQDDSQTLRQFGALDSIVKRSFDIYADSGLSQRCANPDFSSEAHWFVNRIANEAYSTATEGHMGPVHINMQFANPLNSLTETSERNPRIVRIIKPQRGIDIKTAEIIAAELVSRKVMVVAGFMPPDDKLNRSLTGFAELPNVTLLYENISNLHIGQGASQIDALLCRMTDERKNELRPDVVITIGGALVSRMLKEYLRGSEGTEHWTLADTDYSVDFLHRLTTHIDADPALFFSAVGSRMSALLRKDTDLRSPAFAEQWNKMREEAVRFNLTTFSRPPWSELAAFAGLWKRLPENCNIFLSNGTCVRYSQIMPERRFHAFMCNRGVSGIDGTNATAYGAAMAYRGGPTVLLTGDMSFAYSPEILWLKECGLHADLRIVVINNAGGGIFRFIPSTRGLEQRERYFCNDPHLPLRELTEAYKWNYFCAGSSEELEECLDSFIATPYSLLEIKVNPEVSAETLVNWFKETI